MGLPQKDPGQRRRYNQPVRGEWVDLPALEAPVLPAYPMDWYKRDARAFAVPKWIWDLYRQDPVTSQWTPGDHRGCVGAGPQLALYSPEYRLRVQTMLGLNSKGRRDLRWRSPAETASAEKANRKAAEVRRLRIVAEREDKS